MIKISLIAATISAATVAAPTKAIAQQSMRNVVKEIGVSPLTMKSCAQSAGLRRGQVVAKEERELRLSSLLACLRASNPELTKEKFASLLRSARDDR